MKALFIKKTAYVGSYIILAIVMEFITFNAMGLGSFPEYYLLDLMALLMISTIIFIIPSFSVQAIMILVLLGLQTILGFVNESLNKYSGNIFSIDMISLGGEVGGAYNASFVNYTLLLGLIAVFLIECAILFLLRRYRVKQSYKLQLVTTLLVVFCIIQISTTSIYNITIENFASAKVDDKYYILNDNSYLYESFFIKQKAYKKFGTFAFYYKNIGNVFEEFETQTDDEVKADIAKNLNSLNDYFQNGEYSTYNEGYTGAIAGSNVVMVMIESGEWYGINDKFTPTLYALATQGISANNYYSRNKTNHSEALGGIFGTYPKNSVFMENIFYKGSLISNDYSFTLPNILKSDNYVTSFLHNNFGDFYSRNITHKIFGFDNNYFLEDMAGLKGSGLMEGHPKKVQLDDWDLDELMFSTNLDKIIPQTTEGQQFFTFLTTATMHGGYDDLIEYGDYPFNSENENGMMTEKEKAEFSENCLVKDLEEFYMQITRQDFDELFNKLGVSFANYTDEEVQEFYLRYKRYQAAYMSLDAGLESLIKELQDTGKFDNTAIIMYADHSAYYNQQNYHLKNVAEFEYQNPDVYKVPLYIYHGSMGFNNGDENLLYLAQNPKLESTVINRFCCSFDIIPTILDLLGYTYNTNLYHGNSIFCNDSVEDTVFFSMESGIFNDKFFSMDAATLLYGENESKEDKDKYFAQIVEYIEKQKMLEKMYKYDYFAYGEDYNFANISNLVYKLNT
jgi:phosphoglycerol transferase MdoB-like AlkP superfamily enzyme